MSENRYHRGEAENMYVFPPQYIDTPRPFSRGKQLPPEP